VHNKNKHFLSPTRINHILIISMVLMSLLFVCTLLYRCNFGIDLTDEGYYLNWISNPSLYKVTVTQFGYIYHPLYQLVGESIVRLRQADMLIMLGLAWILCTKLLSFVLIEPRKRRAYPSSYIYGLSFALATCVFTFFGSWWWIPTPSYNSLTLEGLLIISITLLNLSTNKTGKISWFILGFGGWLTFMAKPTAALFAGLLSILYIISIRSNTFKKIPFLLLSLLTFFGFFIVSAWSIEGSIHTFILSLQRGVETLTLLYQSHFCDILPPLGFFPDKLTGLIFIVLFTLFFLALSLSPVKKPNAQISFIYSLVILGLLICTNHYMVPLTSNAILGILILIIPFGMGAALLTMPRESLLTQTTVHHFVMTIFFMLLPYLSALGTHSGVWVASFRMGFFWIIAVIPIVKLVKQRSFVRWRIIITLIASSQVLTMALMQVSMEHPYRQLQSLRSQTKTIDITNTKGRVTSQLIIGDNDARYINTLKKVASDHGFSYGDAMIDLTGAYPAALYLLGSKVIGSPWYLLDVGGSFDHSVLILSEIPCDQLLQAWILTSINGPDKCNPRVLEPYGMDSTSLQTIHPIINARDNQKHQLLKPMNPNEQTVGMCQQTHKKHASSHHELQKIMKKSLPSSQEILALFQTYITQNKLNQATLLLKHATRTNPSNPVFYNNLCFAYTLQKKYDPAIQACSQALHFDPNFQLAKNNLAWATNEKSQILNK